MKRRKSDSETLFCASGSSGISSHIHKTYQLLKAICSPGLFISIFIIFCVGQLGWLFYHLQSEASSFRHCPTQDLPRCVCISVITHSANADSGRHILGTDRILEVMVWPLPNSWVHVPHPCQKKTRPLLECVGMFRTCLSLPISPSQLWLLKNSYLY